MCIWAIANLLHNGLTWPKIPRLNDRHTQLTLDSPELAWGSIITFLLLVDREWSQNNAFIIIIAQWSLKKHKTNFSLLHCVADFCACFTTFLVWIIEEILHHMKGLLYDYLYVIRWSLLFLLVIKKKYCSPLPELFWLCHSKFPMISRFFLQLNLLIDKKLSTYALQVRYLLSRLINRTFSIFIFGY